MVEKKLVLRARDAMDVGMLAKDGECSNMIM